MGASPLHGCDHKQCGETSWGRPSLLLLLFLFALSRSCSSSWCSLPWLSKISQDPTQLVPQPELSGGLVLGDLLAQRDGGDSEAMMCEATGEAWRLTVGNGLQVVAHLLMV